MKKAIGLLLAVCLLCASFTACEQLLAGDNSASQTESSVENTSEGKGASEKNSEGSEGGENGESTSFSYEEEERFLSSFGFVIPFIQNSGYRVEDYEGYNGDLMAYENGLAFVAEGLTEEDCEGYVNSLKKDENYNFEYRENEYYYFSREGYFVRLEYYWMKTCFGLTVYTYSYTFEDIESSDTETDSESSDTSADIPDVPKFGFEYEMGRTSCSIVGFYGDEDGIVEIPDTYQGLPVGYICGNAFYGAEEITELIVGDNVLAIEGNAFMLCVNLEKVTLGNSLTVIDMQAFFGCEKLEEITIPATVTFIGSGAFRNCTSLKSVTLGNPEGWCTSDNLHKPFPVEDMSNGGTVAEYFTDTYARVGWLKEE